jgi:hypothetical protein
MVLHLIATQFESLILSVDVFALSYIANNCICMVVDDFFLLPAQLCHKDICIWNTESHMQFAGWHAPWKVTNGAEKLADAGAVISNGKVSATNSQAEQA